MAQPIDGITSKNPTTSSQVIRISEPLPAGEPASAIDTAFGAEAPVVAMGAGAKPLNRLRITKRAALISAAVLLLVAIVLAAKYFWFTPHSVASPAPPASVAFVATPSPSPSPTPSVTSPSPSAAPVHHVKTLMDLNLRSAPTSSSSNVIGVIPAGTIVILKDAASQNGWYHVTFTTTNGQTLDGYVASSSVTVVN